MRKQKKLTERHVTKINVPCSFGGQVSEVAIFVGSPEIKHHPIQFQAKFIQEVKGGMVPQAILDSLEKIQKLSIENGVPFEELCRYALNSLGENQTITDDSQSFTTEEQVPENKDVLEQNPVINANQNTSKDN